MMSAPAFHSYGESIYQPEGEPYIQFQSILLGKTPWSTGFQDFIKALCSAFNGRMKTDVKRRDVRDLMVEEADDPELKERYRSLSLRAITGWFAKAKDELGMINRDRKENSNDWETTFAKPFLARLEKPSEPAKDGVPPSGKRAAAIPDLPRVARLKEAARISQEMTDEGINPFADIDDPRFAPTKSGPPSETMAESPEAMAACAVEALKAKGYRPEPDHNGGVIWKPIEGVEQKEIDRSLRWYLDRIERNIRALIEATRPALE
jgi:hypothetical protein